MAWNTSTHDQKHHHSGMNRSQRAEDHGNGDPISRWRIILNGTTRGRFPSLPYSAMADTQAPSTEGGREALGTPRWIDLTLLTSDKGSWRIWAEQNLHSSPFNSPYSRCLYPSCVWYSVWMSEISNSQQNACQPHTQTQMTIYDMMQ